MYTENLPNGKVKFIETYKDPLTNKYRRVSVTFDKENAQTRKRAIRELEKKINEKTAISTGDITFEELISMFLKEKELKYSSKETYKYLINRLYNFIDRDAIVNRFTPVIINKKIENCTATDIKTLKNILNFAYNKDIINIKISDKLINKKPKKVKKDKLYYEREEVQEILNKIRKNNTYVDNNLAYIIEFLVNTGLRIGECLALTYSDVNGDELTIDKRLYKRNIDTTKTKASTRVIVLNKRSIQIIAETKLLKRIHGIKSDLIFTNRKGELYTYRAIHALLQIRELPTDLHKFRHTHASLLAELGFTLEEIQRRLGHEDSSITKKVYLHATNKMREQEKEKFRKVNIL